VDKKGMERSEYEIDVRKDMEKKWKKEFKLEL
jgi:hypothetical protein